MAVPSNITPHAFSAGIKKYFNATYGQRAPFFSTFPKRAMWEAVNEIPEETLEYLWLTRFANPPHIMDLIFDEFYYALGYKWWKAGKMQRIELDDGRDAAFRIHFQYV